jgi:hypothetical protein
MSIGTYAGPDAISNAISYAKFRSRSRDAVIHVYDDTGNVIEAHEHAGRSVPNLPSARAMQDGVRLALLHFL